MTVHVPRMLNVAHEYIDRPAAAHPDAVAYLYEGERITYRDLRERVQRMSAALAMLGVEMEQRVAVLLPNCPEFVAAFFGAIRVGAVATPMSFAVPPNEQALLLGDSRARAIVTTEALWAPLRGRRAEFPFLRQVLLVDGGGDAAAGELHLDDALRRAEQPGATAGRTAEPSRDPAPTTSDDAAFWLHTSGTTGTPKWAIHPHRDMLFSEQLYARPFVGLRPGDVIVSGSPCFHAYPLGFTTYFALRAGATVALTRQRTTAAHMFDLIRTHRATIFVGVPTLYAQMLQAAETATDVDLSSLRRCFSAAEPLPADLQRRWEERFGVEILDGIGTTEALHVFISNREGDVRRGSSGKAVPGYEIRLVDETGAETPRGEIGNLSLKGGSVFAGYWNRSDVTARVLRGEWYTTGDKYYQDADGYYWYCGRTDDMLRVSGHWVSPSEVESAIISHPAVLEAAVVGKPDADGLVKPRAFVVLRPGISGDERLADELKAHVKSTIAPYSYPRWIDFRDDLPKTATGKIQRYKLRET